MSRRRRTTLPIGEFSSGTLRPADLVDAYADLLRPLRLSRAHRTLIREADRLLARGDRATDDDLADLVDDLQTAADDYVPDYCQVGAHEGDGACFGVWPIVPDPYDDDVVFRLPGNTGPTEYRVPAAYGLALAVNDHGNATLYRRSGRTWREVWSVV